jgi:hypothetical protein
LALAELPDITRAIIALSDMSKNDLECIALERLYAWKALTTGPPHGLAPEFQRWLHREAASGSDS